MNTNDTNSTNLIASISNLFDKYKENPYMLQRLESFLVNLPSLLETEQKKYDERITRINELTMEQDNFYKVFLSKNQYYYMPYNNIFYEYDGKTYKIVREDDIHYNLLSTITDEKKLIVWKYRTKQIIIKKIKDRNLLKSTPETFTIQTVLSFLNTIFASKMEAKYFLTILGDCILRKITPDKHLLFFVSSNLKKFIQIVDNISYVTTGNTIMHYFISKYHDSHNLQSYRLIKTNNNEISHDLVKDMINKIGIDLLCVACHYSYRNDNSDNFLIASADDNIKNHACFFVNHSIDNIISDFTTHCIEFVNSNNDMHSVSWKNMHYIWKQFLSTNNIPNILYSNSLKDMLKSLLSYKEITNGDIVFTGITSKFLPKVGSFLQFWDDHITIIEKDNESEYELDELVSLHKLHNQNTTSYVYLSENDMIKMINHYYPQIEINDSKYVCSILCNLWNKDDELQEMFSIYKENSKKDPNTQNNDDEKLISLDELYEHYRSYCYAKKTLHEKSTPIISKQYFEKYIQKKLEHYIKFEKFIDFKEWSNTS